jgi:steroid Delta-isomerase
MTKLSDLLHRHVERFNRSIDSGDWEPTAAGFADNGEMHFEGGATGPFIGRKAIASAYAEQPPDDHIEVLGTEERDGKVVARYGWRKDNGKPAGEMHLTASEDPDKISKLVVTFQEGLG